MVAKIQIPKGQDPTEHSGEDNTWILDQLDLGDYKDGQGISSKLLKAFCVNILGYF